MRLASVAFVGWSLFLMVQKCPQIFSFDDSVEMCDPSQPVDRRRCGDIAQRSDRRIPHEQAEVAKENINAYDSYQIDMIVLRRDLVSAVPYVYLRSQQTP